MDKQLTGILFLIGLSILMIICSIYGLIVNRKKKKEEKDKKKEGFFESLNSNEAIQDFGQKIGGFQLEKIFDRAKNPWGLTLGTFQLIRYGGLALFFTIAVVLFFLTRTTSYVVFSFGIGLLCFIYPMYYYKAIGNEREAEWNKFYEFIWVIKHNLMLYDPAKAYLNTKVYIQSHCPHNKELIAGFDDFYKYWNPEYIDEYIEKYYCFSVTREITQIVFNMHQTGDFPDEQLSSLRDFIVNQQNLTVETTLSTVSGKATVYSLPFMLVSVIIGLMIPLIFQVIEFF